jgi:hypothetical protein
MIMNAQPNTLQSRHLANARTPRALGFGRLLEGEVLGDDGVGPAVLEVNAIYDGNSKSKVPYFHLN